MKKFSVFLAVIFVATGTLFALESVLIDFSELLDDYQGQHQATFVDYGSVAGARYTEEEKAAMASSLLIPNWTVRLTSSSRTVTNDRLSYVRPVTVGDNAVQFAGTQVMGIRVHYPEGSFNSYAWVKPPFPIPAYATNPVIEDAPRGDQFTGFGVVKNVGAIKSVTANVYGLNYPMGMSVVLINENQETRELPLGYLDFEGWKTLTWQNPNYVNDVRNRVLHPSPLYPRSSPAITFDSLQFYRDGMIEGGDFIVYVKDIVIRYDQAILEEVDTDLDHEEAWGILAQREGERRLAELNRVGNIQVLRYMESRKLDQEEEQEDEGAADDAAQ